MKLLIWLVVVLAVVVWVQRAKKNLVQRARAAAAAAAARGGDHAYGQGGAAPERRMAAIESMVQCAQCGIHFPASEAVYGGTGNNSVDVSGSDVAAETVFCCAEHRALHAARHGAGSA